MQNFSAREILQNEIIEDYGYDPTKLSVIQWSSISCFHIEEPVRYPARGKSYDDLMDNNVALIKAVQSDLFFDLSFYGSSKQFWDASVIPWNGRLLLVCNQYVRGPLIFTWLNLTNYHSFFDNKPYLGIGTAPTMLNQPTVGEDPRILVVNQSLLYVVYSFGNPMRMRIMSIGLENQRISVLKTSLNIELETSVNSNIENAAIQKNWAPFLHNESLFFIQRLNPFTVVSIDSNFENGTSPIAKVISMSNILRLSWKYGTLRGGTNAVQISPDEYLGFFHTTSNIPRRTAARWFVTYFMGAYTFSTSPPFELRRISPVPIIKDSFYRGAWFGKNMDYCVFPSSLYVDHGFAVISLSLQNTDSYMAKFLLSELLNSLENVDPEKQYEAAACRHAEPNGF